MAIAKYYFNFFIGKENSTQSEASPVCEERLKQAREILRAVSSQFTGVRATLERFFYRRGREVEIEGPYLPAGESTIALSIKVTRNANYDVVYEKINETLELHHKHDDRKLSDAYQRALHPTATMSVKPYQWSEKELDFIERMPPEKLCDLVDKNGSPVPHETLMFESSSDGSENQKISDPWDTPAQRAARESLHRVWNGYLCNDA